MQASMACVELAECHCKNSHSAHLPSSVMFDSIQCLNTTHQIRNIRPTNLEQLAYRSTTERFPTPVRGTGAECSADTFTLDTLSQKRFLSKWKHKMHPFSWGRFHNPAYDVIVGDKSLTRREGTLGAFHDSAPWLHLGCAMYLVGVTLR